MSPIPSLSLVDEPDPQPGRHLRQRLAHLQRMGPALQRARPGNHDQRQVVAEGQIADLDVAGGGHGTRSLVPRSLFFHETPWNATSARA